MSKAVVGGDAASFRRLVSGKLFHLIAYDCLLPAGHSSHRSILTIYHSNFGKLNYFLGARAAVEGRTSRYPTIDFCKDPEAICDSEEHQELKWVAGLFYWRK